MSDHLHLGGLRVLAHVGVPEAERAQAQPLVIDLDLTVDLTAASSSDLVADTVDYGAVTALVARVVAETPTALLERVAGRVADAVLAHDVRIEAVRVGVTKVRPPVAQDLDVARVTISRPR